jgi:hypothetical protein
MMVTAALIRRLADHGRTFAQTEPGLSADQMAQLRAEIDALVRSKQLEGAAARAKRARLREKLVDVLDAERVPLQSAYAYAQALQLPAPRFERRPNMTWVVPSDELTSAYADDFKMFSSPHTFS